MRTIASGILLALIITTSAMSQSQSFLTLQEKFSDSKDVYSFNTGGFLARTVLWFAGEHEFVKAIKEIHNISVIIVPTSAFAAKGVSVSGFKRILDKDAFEELGRATDHGDQITFYLKSTQSKNNRYMILMEEPDEVLAIEFTGYVDPAKILNHENISYNNQ